MRRGFRGFALRPRRWRKRVVRGLETISGLVRQHHENKDAINDNRDNSRVLGCRLHGRSSVLNPSPDKGAQDNGETDLPRALIVFTDETALPWLRFLKPGFRHCFAFIDSGEAWVLYNPLSHATELRAMTIDRPDDLAAWYQGRGCKVVACRVRRPPHRIAPVRPYTCVEAVKRVLGIHSSRVLTPWQLYIYLQSARLSENILDNLNK